MREPGDSRRSEPLRVHGYLLLAWPSFLEQWNGLRREVEALRARDPDGYRAHPSTKLLAALRNTILHEIPSEPGAPRFRQGNTLGGAHRHWRRARLFARFRLFFRFSDARAFIAYVWLNDDTTLRKSGARSDVYQVFRRMLERGHPPTDLEALMRACEPWEGFGAGDR